MPFDAALVFVMLAGVLGFVIGIPTGMNLQRQDDARKRRARDRAGGEEW